ncbi:MAG: hypothetical protein HYZ55_02275 [Nitrosarchaeum sp.]|nr:hypothetical protein [Nitrosarchaeum sp.]
MKTSSIILIASFVVGLSIISTLVILNPPKSSIGAQISFTDEKSRLQKYWEDVAKNSQNTIIIREQKKIKNRPFEPEDPRIEINGLKSEYAKDEPINFEVLVIGDGSGCGSIWVSVFREFEVQSPIFSQGYVSVCDGSEKYVGIPISFSINTGDGQIPYLEPGKYEVRASYYQDRGSFGDVVQEFRIV